MASSRNLEEQLMAVIRRYPEGVSDAMVAQEVPHLTAAERGTAINKLVQSKRVQLFEQGPTKTLVYKEMTQEQAVKYKGLSTEEMMLFQIIQSAGNTGLWTKDMRARTNLPQPIITKILKTLENRSLVKSVKNVNNPTRKVYMLAELEPSKELTGGTWYTNNQLDAAFIEVLRKECLDYIKKMGNATLRDITNHIKRKQIAKVDLKEEDINCIVQTLVYDYLVDSVEGDDNVEQFRPEVWPLQESTAFTDAPCGHCPVIDQCHDDGVISPATCEYFQKWLQF